MRTYFVYILTDRYRRILYTGMTNDLVRRLHKHRSKFYPDCYTARYNVHYLAYFEPHPNSIRARIREKEIKLMTRAEREELIRRFEAEEEGCPLHLKNEYAPPKRMAPPKPRCPWPGEF